MVGCRVFVLRFVKHSRFGPASLLFEVGGEPIVVFEQMQSGVDFVHPTVCRRRKRTRGDFANKNAIYCTKNKPEAGSAARFVWVKPGRG